MTEETTTMAPETEKPAASRRKFLTGAAATTTAGSGQFSSSVTRRSLVCGGSRGMSRGTGREDFGTRPRYCSTSEKNRGRSHSIPDRFVTLLRDLADPDSGTHTGQ
jgi:hypothetical protein